jgi:hypothetical protein
VKCSEFGDAVIKWMEKTPAKRSGKWKVEGRGEEEGCDIVPEGEEVAPKKLVKKKSAKKTAKKKTRK